MSTPVNVNLEKLKTAGLIINEDELPADHQKVIEDLTEDEVDILESIKGRFDAADKAQGLGPQQPGEHPPFATFVIF